MGELEEFVGCTIKRYLINMTLNIYQPCLVNNITQEFNEDV